MQRTRTSGTLFKTISGRRIQRFISRRVASSWRLRRCTRTRPKDPRKAANTRTTWINWTFSWSKTTSVFASVGKFQINLWGSRIKFTPMLRIKKDSALTSNSILSSHYNFSKKDARKTIWLCLGYSKAFSNLRKCQWRRDTMWRMTIFWTSNCKGKHKVTWVNKELNRLRKVRMTNTISWMRFLILRSPRRWNGKCSTGTSSRSIKATSNKRRIMPQPLIIDWSRRFRMKRKQWCRKMIMKMSRWAVNSSSRSIHTPTRSWK